MNLDIFTAAYIEAMLWAETDDDCEPLEKNYDAGDFNEDAMKSIVADCTKFQELNWELLTDENYLGSGEWSHEEIGGHDFWLTRAGHGCGFWDGGWEETARRELTDSCKRFGEVWVYVGDDKNLHIA